MREDLYFAAEEVKQTGEESRTTGEYLAFMAAQKGGMSLLDAEKARHSVRKFLDADIEEEKAAFLQKAIDDINEKTGFSFRLYLNEPEAFSDGKSADYGSFSNCRNYFALVAPKGEDVKVGYWGEHLVLLAQILGLNTCWVKLTYRKSKVKPELKEGEKLHIVIALGYGANQGKEHTSKDMLELCKVKGEMPEWFENGMKSAMLAPTAVNHQQFLMILNEDGTVTPKARIGSCVKIDLGIVMYHFEIGAGEHQVEFTA